MAEALSPNYGVNIDRQRIAKLEEAHHQFYGFLPDPDIHYGPLYRIATSQGQQLEFFTGYATQHPEWFAYAPPITRTYFMFGRNPDQGVLTSFRYANIYRRGDRSSAKGDVMTFQRGQGAAIPTELVHMDMLANEAVQGGTDITYIAENVNAQALKAITRRHRQDPTYAEYITALKDEQARWLRIYGHKGVLGFEKESPEFVFTFNSATEEVRFDFEGTKEVHLERVDYVYKGRKRVMGVVRSRILGMSPEIVQEQKAEQFEKTWRPLIEHALEG